MLGLGETKISERRYYPMVVSEKGTDERMSPEEDAIVWDAFEKLSQEQKDVLLSGEMPQKIKMLQEKLKLSDLTTGSISLVIRRVFFGGISLDGMDEKLQTALTSGGDDVQKVEDISEFIQKEILTIQPKPRVEKEEAEEVKRSPEVMVRMPLLQALSKYESLGNQLITRERIKVKSQPEPVRPSLLYWIKYYRDELGIGHHNSVQRGDFLFRSENGKRLSAEERERVNLVLKSVEENLPLQIDTEHSEIVFPLFETSKPFVSSQIAFQEPPLAPQKTEPRDTGTAFSFGRGLSFGNTEVAPINPGALSFSSKHVFPAEKSEAVPIVSPPQRGPDPIVSPPVVTPVSVPTPTALPTPTPEVPAAPVITRANHFYISPVSLGKEE